MPPDPSFSTTFDIGGPVPSNGDTIKVWHDLSGNGHHAVAATGGTAADPTYSSTALKGDTVGIDSIGRKLSLSDSASSFDGWDTMTVFMLYEWNGIGPTWHAGLDKGGKFPNTTSWLLQTMNNNGFKYSGNGVYSGEYQ